MWQGRRPSRRGRGGWGPIWVGHSVGEGSLGCKGLGTGRRRRLVAAAGRAAVDAGGDSSAQEQQRLDPCQCHHSCALGSLVNLKAVCLNGKIGHLGSKDQPPCSAEGAEHDLANSHSTATAAQELRQQAARRGRGLVKGKQDRSPG